MWRHGRTEVEAVGKFSLEKLENALQSEDVPDKIRWPLPIILDLPDTVWVLRFFSNALYRLLLHLLGTMASNGNRFQSDRSAW